MSQKILKLEDIIQENASGPENTNTNKVNKQKENGNTPRGLPKSGRTWKTPKKRFSSIIKTRGLKKANKFEKRQALKESINRVRDLTRSIVEKKQQEIEKKKERRRMNLKRQEENRLKSEVVQVIKNSAKLKRMRKKQLRNIEKRDTLKSGLGRPLNRYFQQNQKVIYVPVIEIHERKKRK